MAAESFFQWLTEQVTEAVSRSRSDAALIIWCDPEQVWKDLLKPVAETAGCELWADGEAHELELREKIGSSSPHARIIWLPRSREEITYLKVVELSADKIWTTSLPDALIEFGVSPAKIHELGSSLAAFARTQFMNPRSSWLNLTDQDTCNDSCILEVISGESQQWDDLHSTDRFSIFQRRVTQEFGLPSPEGKSGEEWRKKAVAVLVCTDAVQKSAERPFNDPSFLIADDRQWKKAQDLLHQWTRRIDLFDTYEKIVPLAEAITPLRFWVQDIPLSQEPFASFTVEHEIWKKEVKKIQSLQKDEELVSYLTHNLDAYTEHAAGFWGKDAHSIVPWNQLVAIAQLAQQLYGEQGCAALWREPTDAVGWYISRGWKTDQAGEALFRDEGGLSNGILKLRTRLRTAYLHHLDTINRAFSDLIANNKELNLNLPFGGTKITEVITSREGKDLVAVLILDACRYDIGCRLVEKINQGEPAERAVVQPMVAPVPTITPLGMAFCLPDVSQNASVIISKKEGSFAITVPEFKGNLAIAEKRREYLRQYYHLQDKKARYFLTVKELLELHPDTLNTRSLGKLVFVFGDELDKEGHDDQLIITGADDHLGRYERVVRTLRNSGYTTILILTDHGFFHWDPADDEIIPKPGGDIIWKSRRAIVGYNLTHGTALNLRVSGSDLECRVPRSVNAFETYGGLGYFHGGVTLQELVVPFIVIRYPKKGKKIGAVIKPVSQITSLEQRIEIAPAGSVQKSLDGSLDENAMSRTVIVKVVDKEAGITVFRSKQPAILTPGGESQTIVLTKVKDAHAMHNTKLELLVCDADTEEILDRKEVELKIELDEWF